MDWKAAMAAFAMVFLSELGDKTQLVTMAVAAQSRSPFMVFMGAAGALCLSALLGVMVGDAVVQWIPAAWLRMGAGVAFVAVGAFLLMYR